MKNLYASLGRYRLLYLLSALELIIIISWSLYLNGKGNPDTPTYYSAYDVIVSGKLDVLRTPLYPLFIGSLKSIFGYKISKALVYILQSLIFIFSIKWLGKTLDNITSHKRVSYWFTAVYALYPGMLTLCGAEMTESLSLSLMAAVTYLASEAYYHNSRKMAVISGLICLLLWLLRPSLLPVTLIMLVFWICILLFKGRNLRETAFWGSCATLISLAGLSIYVTAFNKEYHKVGVSCVSTWNNYVTLREAKAIDTRLIDSPKLKAAIDSILDNNGINIPVSGIMWEEIKFLQDEFGLEDIDHFVNNQIKLHPAEIFSLIYHERLECMLKDDCISIGGQGAMPYFISSITRLFRANIATVFLIFLIAFCILIYDNIKARQISYFIWLLLLLFAENYLTILIGAPNAFTRLSTPYYPVLIAILCWILDQLVTIATYSGYNINNHD